MGRGLVPPGVCGGVLELKGVGLAASEAEVVGGGLEGDGGGVSTAEKRGEGSVSAGSRGIVVVLRVLEWDHVTICAVAVQYVGLLLVK